MPKETSIKALQKKKAQVAHSARRVSYSLIDLASNEEYFDSNDDLDESSDDNFMELEDPDEIIRLLAVSLEKKTSLLEASGEESVLSRAEEARYTTVFYFFQLLLQGQKKLETAEIVANIVNGRPWLARSIRVWANICLRKELIQPDLCKKSPSKSLLYDKLVSLKVASYLHSQKFKVDPIMVKSYFEQQILPQLNIESVQYISVRTARLEREQLLCKKRLDSTVHVSDFLTETIGPLKDDQKKACVLGTNRDGYWDSVKLLKQVQQAIKIFERTHSECVGIFAFDNATFHKAFSEDALVASKMNLGPSGLAPKMCETMWSS
ncbi:34657_t:CDS:2, partial [Gigaspora margarita]